MPFDDPFSYVMETLEEDLKLTELETGETALAASEPAEPFLKQVKPYCGTHGEEITAEPRQADNTISITIRGQEQVAAVMKALHDAGFVSAQAETLAEPATPKQEEVMSMNPGKLKPFHTDSKATAEAASGRQYSALTEKRMEPTREVPLAASKLHPDDAATLKRWDDYLDPKGYWGDPSGNIRRMGGEQDIIAITNEDCSEAEWRALCGIVPLAKAGEFNAKVWLIEQFPTWRDDLRPHEVELAERAYAAGQAASGAQPFAYACPANCGCIWRDNKDGTMSLFGKRSQSCEICEPLSLDRLIPLFVAAPAMAQLSAKDIERALHIGQSVSLSGGMKFFEAVAAELNALLRSQPASGATKEGEK